MELDHLRALLDLLEEFGVESYEDDKVRLALRQPSPEPSSAPVIRPAPTAVDLPRSMWEEPGLWPGGIPPKFPGKDTK